MPEPVILDRKPSIFTHLLAELRDEQIQQDRMRFRLNLERAGELFAFEISRTLNYAPRLVETPLGELEQNVLSNPPVLGAILRAALPMHAGFLRIFDQADNAFISAYRHPTDEFKFTIKVEYISCPGLAGRTFVLIDPMIATGRSMIACYEEVVQRYGAPERLYMVGLIASEEGLTYVQRRAPDAHIYVGAVDSELTAKSYIVPGLGDAGDLAYGEKM